MLTSLTPGGGGVDRPPAALDGPGRPALAPRPVPARGAGPRVLVVEDEWLISIQLEQTLAAAGFEVVGTAAARRRRGARRAGAARPRADGHPPPRPGGRYRGRAEIADRFGIRSLFVSAHGSDPATVACGSSVSPAGWLPKPFTETELLRAVRAALSLP